MCKKMFFFLHFLKNRYILQTKTKTKKPMQNPQQAYYRLFAIILYQAGRFKRCSQIL